MVVIEKEEEIVVAEVKVEKVREKGGAQCSCIKRDFRHAERQTISKYRVLVYIFCDRVIECFEKMCRNQQLINKNLFEVTYI